MAIEEVVKEHTEVIEDFGKILWVGRMTPSQKRSLLRYYGPGWLDVERNTKSRIHYDNFAYAVYNTDGLIEYALRQRKKIEIVLNDTDENSRERFYRLYLVCFGLRRVTYTQLSAVMAKLSEADLAVPQRNAWYYHTGSYTTLLHEYIEWLKNTDLSTLPECRKELCTA